MVSSKMPLPVGVQILKWTLGTSWVRSLVRSKVVSIYCILYSTVGKEFRNKFDLIGSGGPSWLSSYYYKAITAAAAEYIIWY